MRESSSVSASRRSPSKRRLSPVDAAAADARMRRCLRDLAMEKIYEAAQRSGWYTTTGAELAEGALIFDYGTYVDIAWPGDGLYRVADYDASSDIVSLRKIGNVGQIPVDGTL